METEQKRRGRKPKVVDNKETEQKRRGRKPKEQEVVEDTLVVEETYVKEDVMDDVHFEGVIELDEKKDEQEIIIVDEDTLHVKIDDLNKKDIVQDEKPDALDDLEKFFVLIKDFTAKDALVKIYGTDKASEILKGCLTKVDIVKKIKGQ